MNLVADPRHAPLVAEGRFRNVGRVDPLPGWGPVRRRAPADPVAVDVELGQPDSAQDLDDRDLPQPGRRVAPEGLQQAIAVGADGPRVRVTLIKSNAPRRTTFFYLKSGRGAV
jgi:hypothetical protein